MNHDVRPADQSHGVRRSPAVGMKQRNGVQDDAVAAGVRRELGDVQPDAITDRA